MITLADNANERSTYVVTAEFTDEDGASVVPTSAAWSLYDADGAVVNSRASEALSPAASVDIVLSGDDLALTGDDDSRVRYLLVEAVYTSSLGSGLPLRDQARFVIDNLTGVA